MGEVVYLQTVESLVEEEEYLYLLWQEASDDSNRYWERLLKVRETAIELDRVSGQKYYYHDTEEEKEK